MAERIGIDTGIKTFSLNDKCEVSFNPTDISFVERLFNTFDTLDKKQDAYKNEIDAAKGTREVFAIGKKRDLEMRELVDGVFQAPVCDALFGDMNVYAMSGGLPVWCNLMLAVMDEVDTTFTREQKATNPRVQKYMQKYHR